MKRKTLPLALFMALLFSFLFCGKLIQAIESKPSETILIRADGSVEPNTAPIQKIGSVYYLTSDCQRIIIDRSNIILDGNMYRIITVSAVSAIYIRNVNNVTIKNCVITNCEVGIMADRSTNISILNNTINETSAPVPELQLSAGISFWAVNSSLIADNYLSNNYCAIFVAYDSTFNRIVGNNMTKNSYAISFWESSGNKFFHNCFLNNAHGIFDRESTSINIWDNGYPSGGNYWSKFNATDIDGDGIADQPHNIDENNVDNYPLMYPYDKESDAILLPPPESFPSTLVIASVITVTVIIGGLLVYFKKRKH